MAINQNKVQIEEISSILTPVDGISLDQVLIDAELAGYQIMEVDRENNRIKVIWFKKD